MKLKIMLSITFTYTLLISLYTGLFVLLLNLNNERVYAEEDIQEVIVDVLDKQIEEATINSFSLDNAKITTVTNIVEEIEAHITGVAGISLVIDKLTDEDTDKVIEIIEDLNAEKNPFKSITDREITMIERLVEAEATEGGVEEKSYVASVILNRMLSDAFPDTVEGVIFQKVSGRYQFSPLSDGRYYDVEISDDTKEAVQKVINDGDTAQGALFFRNPKASNSSTDKWFASLDYLFKDNINHYFYK